MLSPGPHFHLWLWDGGLCTPTHTDRMCDVCVRTYKHMLSPVHFQLQAKLTVEPCTELRPHTRHMHTPYNEECGTAV